jgi:phage shock protein A
MGLYDRLKRVVDANLNDLVSKAEDPEKMLEQALLEMQEDMVKLRQGVAQAIAAQKRTEKQYNEAVNEVNKWQRNAQLALQKCDEDLARQALERKKTYNDTSVGLKTSLDQQTIQVEGLKKNLIQLESKISEAKTKKEMLKARITAAKAQEQLGNMESGMSTSSAMSAFERMEQKVLIQESRAQSTAELISSDLESQFAKLKSGSDIDDELAKLKAELKRLNPEQPTSTVTGSAISKITGNITTPNTSSDVKNPTMLKEKPICKDTQIPTGNHSPELVKPEKENNPTPTNSEKSSSIVKTKIQSPQHQTPLPTPIPKQPDNLEFSEALLLSSMGQESHPNTSSDVKNPTILKEKPICKDTQIPTGNHSPELVKTEKENNPTPTHSEKPSSIVKTKIQSPQHQTLEQPTSKATGSAISKITGNITTTNTSSDVKNPTIPEEEATCDDTQISTVDDSPELVKPEKENNPTSTNLEKSSSIVKTKIQSPQHQTLLPTHIPEQPDNSAPSEALLIGQESQNPKTVTTSSFRNFVLSPLRIGSMLSLLLTTLTLGYLVLNSKNLPFDFSNLFNSNSPRTTKNTELIDHNSQSTTKPKITSIPKYPNLATQEFRQLRDTKDIVDLTPKVKPTPEITSNNSQN